MQRGIEVGHVFFLGTKYSEAMQRHLSSMKTASRRLSQMGCYGIGVTRLAGAAIEQSHDEQAASSGRTPLRPFEVVICPMN